MRTIVVAILLCGCGSKADDCERVVKKLSSAMTSELGDAKPDELIAECRKDMAKLRSDPTMKCVLDADGDDAVRACVNDGVAKANKEAAEMKARAEKAEAEAATAVADAKAARDKLEKVQADLDELDAKVSKAVSDVANASNAAAIEAARQRLAELQKEQHEFRNRIEAAKAEAAKAERAKGVHISPECLKNPLAKGCS